MAARRPMLTVVARDGSRALVGSSSGSLGIGAFPRAARLAGSLAREQPTEVSAAASKLTLFSLGTVARFRDRVGAWRPWRSAARKPGAAGFIPRPTSHDPASSSTLSSDASPTTGLSRP